MQAKLARSGGQICLKSPRTECDSFAFFSPLSWKKCHICCDGNPNELKASALKYCRKSWITCNTALLPLTLSPSGGIWWGGVSQLPEWLISTLTICIFLTKDFTKPSPGKGGWEEAETHSWLCHSSGWRMRHKLPLQNHSFLNAKLVQQLYSLGAAVSFNETTYWMHRAECSLTVAKKVDSGATLLGLCSGPGTSLLPVTQLVTQVPSWAPLRTQFPHLGHNDIKNRDDNRASIMGLCYGWNAA